MKYGSCIFKQKTLEAAYHNPLQYHIVFFKLMHFKDV